MPDLQDKAMALASVRVESSWTREEIEDRIKQDAVGKEGIDRAKEIGGMPCVGY